MKNNRGFTLVELLVVVAIIAILSVIGLTIFTSAQSNARDARRKSDIEAIANALETGKEVASLTYKPLTIGQFSGGSIPIDSTTAKYCIKVDTTVTAVADPATWAGGTAATACPPAGDGTWVEIGSTTPATTTKSWKVCARLEASTDTALKVFCKGSAQ